MSISGPLTRFSNVETNTNCKNIEYESKISNNNNDDYIISKPSLEKKFNIVIIINNLKMKMIYLWP